MSKKRRRHKRRKKPVADTINVRDLIIKGQRAPHRPTQTHEDKTQYNRAREKDRTQREEE